MRREFITDTWLLLLRKNLAATRATGSQRNAKAPFSAILWEVFARVGISFASQVEFGILAAKNKQKPKGKRGLQALPDGRASVKITATLTRGWK